VPVVPPDPLLTGSWRRTLLVRPDGSTDATSSVTWLQAGAYYVDLRLPAGLPRPAPGPVTGLPAADLPALATVEGFAGRLRADGPWTCWDRAVDLHPPALAAVATPTVNSYKRLAPRLADGSISWAPTVAAYGHNNRSCMLRLPANRPAVENRGVDSAANTYLAFALMLAAGLEGIELGLDPGDPVEGATYDWSDGREQATRLPRTLLEAVDAFAADPLVAEVFAPQFVAEYVDMKRREWDDYHAEVTAWERRRYLRDL
jgi:glutamine synthetase